MIRDDVKDRAARAPDVAPAGERHKAMGVNGSPSRVLAPHTIDRALLAFVKCHITSMARWDLLRVLAERGGAWTRPEQLAREAHRSLVQVQAVMDELWSEGLLDVAEPPDEPAYRLREGDPTSVVVARLIARATECQELREIIVTHIVRSALSFDARIVGAAVIPS